MKTSANTSILNSHLRGKDTARNVVFMLHVGQVHDVVKQQLTRALGGDARNAFVGAVHNDFFELADFRIDIDAVVGVHRLVFSSGAKVGEMMVMLQ